MILSSLRQSSTHTVFSAMRITTDKKPFANPDPNSLWSGVGSGHLFWHRLTLMLDAAIPDELGNVLRPSGRISCVVQG